MINRSFFSIKSMTYWMYRLPPPLSSTYLTYVRPSSYCFCRRILKGRKKETRRRRPKHPRSPLHIYLRCARDLIGRPSPLFWFDAIKQGKKKRSKPKIKTTASSFMHAKKQIWREKKTLHHRRRQKPPRLLNDLSCIVRSCQSNHTYIWLLLSTEKSYMEPVADLAATGAQQKASTTPKIYPATKSSTVPNQ